MLQTEESISQSREKYKHCSCFHIVLLSGFYKLCTQPQVFTIVVQHEKDTPVQFPLNEGNSTYIQSAYRKDAPA